MYSVILTVHVIVCALVVLTVLIQAGRSGGFSGLMGGGGGDALFSTSSQQSGLRKATVALAALFMATSFFLTILSGRRAGRSVFSSMPNGGLSRTVLPAVPPPAADTSRKAPEVAGTSRRAPVAAKRPAAKHTK